MTSTEIKNYVLNKIEKTDINIYPFYNLYVENIFPDDFYQRLKDKMLYYKHNETLQDRNWDNPNFMNKRFNAPHDKYGYLNIIFKYDAISPEGQTSSTSSSSSKAISDLDKM